MKFKKRLLSIIACVILVALLLPSTLASAKSLANSFSGYTNVFRDHGSYWRKSCTARTDGYYAYHYVRAYIGGTKNSPSGAWVDSGRCYSNGNIVKTVYTKAVKVIYDSLAPLYFPTGYAKYGT